VSELLGAPCESSHGSDADIVVRAGLHCDGVCPSCVPLSRDACCDNVSPGSATVCDDCGNATALHDSGVGAMRRTGKDDDGGGVGGDACDGDGALSATHGSGGFGEDGVVAPVCVAIEFETESPDNLDGGCRALPSEPLNTDLLLASPRRCPKPSSASRHSLSPLLRPSLSSVCCSSLRPVPSSPSAACH